MKVIITPDLQQSLSAGGKWSGKIATKWHPPEGFFKGKPEDIAKGLKKASSGLKQAMSRLNLYINRAGKNLSKEEKRKLNITKAKLHMLFGAPAFRANAAQD